LFEPISFFVSFLIILPAVILSLRGSSWLVDYLFLVVALNRGIRRVVDYNNGFFNPTSTISLTPIIVGGLAVLVVLNRLNSNSDQYGRSNLSVIYRYSAATAFAFVIGFINIRAAAVYALGDYIAPIGLLGFGAIYADRPDIFQRWCNSVGLTGVIVAGYGIWQFYTIPPWDAFWVTAVNFEGYLGVLEPTKMTLFSTMAERGPAAAYLSCCLVIVALRPNTLGIIRLPAAVLIAAAMLLTFSRTAIIQFAIALILYPILNRGSGKYITFFVIVIAVLFGESLLSFLPGEGRAMERVSTIGNISSDGSFTGRLVQLRAGISFAATEPLGLGLGSHGMGSRVTSVGSMGMIDSTGYVEALRTYGWGGFFVLVTVFVSIWRSSTRLLKAEGDDPNLYLFRTWYISGLIASFSGSWVFTATFFWVLAGYTLERSDKLEMWHNDDGDYAMDETISDY
jgi:putative inorganic carbon (HCO3(-)) transporter